MERKLPSNLEAEHAALGAILLDNEAFHPTIEILEPADFFLDAHRRLFARMVRLSEQNRAIDLVTLHDELERAGELEAAGGSAYLSSLIDGVPHVSNVRHYARIVKEKAERRRLIDMGCRLAEQAQDETVPLANLAQILSAQPTVAVRAERKLFTTAAEIATEGSPEIHWVAKPWVAEGAITELDGKIKLAGKTTFITRLVRAVLDGEPFMGEPTAKTPVVYLTEQPKSSFRVALERADLLGREDLIVLYRTRVFGLAWDAICRLAVEECKRHGAKLLIVDTLPSFAGLEGDKENNSGDALAAMAPLQAATDDGLAVYMSRHERKAGGLVGDAGRGSSAFGGAADILMLLRRPRGNVRPNVRHIEAIGRFDETPAKLVVELQEGGYVALGSSADVAAQEAEKAILAALPDSEAEALTLDEVIESTETKRATAQRVIKSFVETRRLARVGSGKRGNPFRYFIARIHSAQTSAIDGRNESEPAAEHWQCPPGCNPPHTGPDEHAAAFIKALQERGFIGALQHAPAPGGVAAGRRP